jgi:putative chitinase
MDRAAFFDVMRSEFGALSQSQVEGTEKLLDEGERRGTALRQLAYILSTSWHETAATMQPIAEYGLGAGHEYGEPCEDYNDQVAYGRGYVQLTWQENYERADKECVLNGALLKDFDLALDGPTAARIIFEGMSDGWFTGKKLSDYINESITNYWDARRIVNGTDKADLLEGYAYAYQAALEAAKYGQAEPEVPESGVSPEDGEHLPPPEGGTPPVQPEHPKTLRYEYAITEPGDFTLEANKMGAKGWRLVHIDEDQVIWESVKH